MREHRNGGFVTVVILACAAIGAGQTALSIPPPKGWGQQQPQAQQQKPAAKPAAPAGLRLARYPGGQPLRAKWNTKDTAQRPLPADNSPMAVKEVRAFATKDPEEKVFAHYAGYMKTLGFTQHMQPTAGGANSRIIGFMRGMEIVSVQFYNSAADYTPYLNGDRKVPGTGAIFVTYSKVGM